MKHNIAERLNEHSLPVDASYWAEMEERLLRRSRKTRSILLWFSSSGIAAAIALLLVFNITYKNSNNIPILVNKTVPLQSETSPHKKIATVESNQQSAVTQKTGTKGDHCFFSEKG